MSLETTSTPKSFVQPALPAQLAALEQPGSGERVSQLLQQVRDFGKACVEAYIAYANAATSQSATVVWQCRMWSEVRECWRPTKEDPEGWMPCTHAQAIEMRGEPGVEVRELHVSNAVTRLDGEHHTGVTIGLAMLATGIITSLRKTNLNFGNLVHAKLYQLEAYLREHNLFGVALRDEDVAAEGVHIEPPALAGAPRYPEDRAEDRLRYDAFLKSNEVRGRFAHLVVNFDGWCAARDDLRSEQFTESRIV